MKAKQVSTNNVKKAPSVAKNASAPRTPAKGAKAQQKSILGLPSPTGVSSLRDAFLAERERSTTALKKFYFELFGEEELPDQPEMLVSLRIEYELVRLAHEALGKTMSEKCQQNYEAAQSFNVSGFTETMRSLVRSEIEEETKMKKTNKAKGARLAAGGHSFKRAAGKTLGLGVAETWVHLFSQNEKVAKAKRMTDEQITAFLLKEFPGKESKVFSAVSTVRSRYNRGILSKGELPKAPSHAYDEDGNAIVRGEKKATAKAKPAKGEKLAPPKKLTTKKAAPKKAAPVEEEEVVD